MRSLRLWGMMGMLLFGTLSSGAQPVAMDDSSLGHVTGQDGVAFQIEFDLNAQGDSSKTAVLNNDMQPLASLGGCVGTGSPCRLAIEAANHTYNGGEWLVFKDTYASFRIFTLDLNGASVASAGSNASYFDITKFENATGLCLLPMSCSTGSLNALNALVLSFPTVATSYSPSTRVSSGYTSMQMGIDIGRMSMEYGPTGYNNDTNPNSFLGIKIADTNGPMAGIAVQGKAFVYGF